MANYNEPVGRLTQLDPSLPSDNETSDKTAAMIRQLRGFLVQFLQVAHQDDGQLKSLGISQAAIGEGQVRGSNDNAATDPNEIAHDSVSTPDLKNAAVTTAKLADAAVTTAKITDANVTEAKLASSAVTTSKIADNAVTTPKIVAKAVTDVSLANDASVDANRAVGTNHIKDSAVTTAKINAGAVTAAKVEPLGAATLLVGNGVDNTKATIGGAMTATLIGTVLTFALGGITNGGAGRLAMLSVEKAQNSNLVSGDFAAAYTGTVQHVKFTNEFDPGSIISLDSNGSFIVSKIGFYAVFAQIDFDSATYSRLLLGQVNAGGTGYDSYAASSNGNILLGFFNVTAENTRFALVFKDAALSATQGTAKNTITGERYATLVILAL